MPIDRLAPKLDRLISVDQKIEVLGGGYATDISSAEYAP